MSREAFEPESTPTPYEDKRAAFYAQRKKKLQEEYGIWEDKLEPPIGPDYFSASPTTLRKRAIDSAETWDTDQPRQISREVGNSAYRGINTTTIVLPVEPVVEVPDRADDDETQLPVDEVALRRLRRADVEDALQVLEPQSNDVLSALYGLDDGNPKKQAEVSRLYGISKKDVHEIGRKALAEFKDTYYPTALRDWL